MEARDHERARNRSHHAATCYPVPGACHLAMTGLGAQRLGTIGVPNPSVPMRRRVRGGRSRTDARPCMLIFSGPCVNSDKTDAMQQRACRPQSVTGCVV